MNEEERQRYYELGRKLVAEQSFIGAIVGGAGATVLAAGIYAIITVASGGFSYGFMAAGIGVLIGLAMQFLGRGLESKYTALAMIYAVVGYLLGNIMVFILFIARLEQASPLDILARTESSEMVRWSLERMQFVDVLFFIAAIAGTGYFVKRRLSHDEGNAIRTYEMMGE